MTNRRALPLLLGLFVVLAAVALLQSQNSPSTIAIVNTPTPEVTEEPSLSGTLLRVFPDLTVLDIQAIRIQNPNTEQTLTLSRDAEGNWTAPDNPGELNIDAARDIARTLVLLPYGRSINILQDTDLADYGFLPTPAYLISIVLANGQGHVIALGKISESEPIYYALVDERDEIFEIERGAIDFLTNFVISPPINLTN